MDLTIWILACAAWLAIGAFGFGWYKVGITRRDLTTDDLPFLAVASLAGVLSLLTTLSFLPPGPPRVIWRAKSPR